MNWIPVSQRVPDNRRQVLTWGAYNFIWPGPRFLGVSKYNPGGRGFDNERGGIMLPPMVTHWAEIVGPDEPSIAALTKAATRALDDEQEDRKC